MHASAAGLSVMRHFVFLFAASLLATACVQQPPQTLALQCISGSAQWSPMTLDFENRSVGGHPAVITDDAIRWETVSRNGFGGATHTQYGISRSSGAVTAEGVYVDRNGIRAIEPTNRYSGECYARHRPL
jgi:hypothetical protein